MILLAVLMTKGGVFTKRLLTIQKIVKNYDLAGSADDKIVHQMELVHSLGCCCTATQKPCNSFG